MFNTQKQALQWEYLGSGTYNEVYLSTNSFTLEGCTSRWVHKTPLDNIPSSHVDRAIRKWRTLNPEFPVIKSRTGWLVPYLGNTQASDAAIAEKLIEIYRRHRIIVEDAGGSQNFLFFQGKTVCIDVDLAARRGSVVSDNNFNSFQYQNKLANYLDKIEESGQWMVAKIIRTLGYLEHNLSAGAIKDEYITLGVLACLDAFQQYNAPLTVDILNILVIITQLYPDNDIPPYLITPSLVKELLVEQQVHAISNDIFIKTAFDQATCIQRACSLNKADYAAELRWIITQDFSYLNKVGRDGYTPLHLSVILRVDELFFALLKNQVDLTRRSADYSSYVFMKYPNMSAFDIAVCTDNLEMHEFLLDAGGGYFSSNVLPELLGVNMQDKMPSEALSILRWHLQCYAIKSDDLSFEQKNQLHDLLMKQPHLLTWVLDREGNTCLDLAFSSNHEAFIRSLLDHPQWHRLCFIKHSKTNNTLLHQVMAASYDELKRIEWCNLLVDSGVRPQSLNNKGKTAESLWTGTADINPLKCIRESLYALASNQNIEHSTDFLLRLKTVPSLLTWFLDANGNTFNHVIFEFNTLHLIDEVTKFPHWYKFSYTLNAKDQTLFDIIAMKGHVVYFDLLKHLATNSLQKNIALHYASEAGQAAFCKKLMYFGASPTAEKNEYQLPETSWRGAPITNPFRELREDLLAIALNKVSFEEPEHAQLLELAIRYPHFLTWPLDEMNNTLIHCAVLSRHKKLLRRLETMPEWEELCRSFNNAGETPEAIALKIHPVNPFQIARQRKDLLLKKEALLAFFPVTDQISSYLPSFFHRPNNERKELYRGLLEAHFSETDSPSKSSDELLYDVICKWQCNHPHHLSDDLERLMTQLMGALNLPKAPKRAPDRPLFRYPD